MYIVRINSEKSHFSLVNERYNMNQISNFFTKHQEILYKICGYIIQKKHDQETRQCNNAKANRGLVCDLVIIEQKSKVSPYEKVRGELVDNFEILGIFAKIGVFRGKFPN